MKRALFIILGLVLVCTPSVIGYRTLFTHPECVAPAGIAVDDYRALLVPTILGLLLIFTAGTVVSLLGARRPRRFNLAVPEGVARRATFIRAWTSEYQSVANQREVTTTIGLVFACTASLLPGLCVSLLFCVASACGSDGGAALRTTVQYTALGVLGAALTSLFLSYVEFCSRLAGRDLNDRVFEEALRSMLLATLCAMIAGIMIGTGAVTSLSWIDRPDDMLFVGAALGVIGNYLFVAAMEFIGLIFGHTAGLDEDTQSFIWIDGLDDPEAVRLREIGIRSAHALAFAPPPYIFFRTRYPLARICDWQDQAFLYVCLGPTLVRELRSASSFRGALDLLALVESMHQHHILTDSPADALAQLRARLLAQPQLVDLATWRICTVLDDEVSATQSPTASSRTAPPETPGSAAGSP